MSNPKNTQATNATSAMPVSSGKLSSSAREGQSLFQSIGCSGCHSVNGTGGTIGPDLSNEGKRGRTRDWLTNQITNPKSHNPNTGMPAFSTLSDQQLSQLVDYLLSLGADGAPSALTPASTTQSQAIVRATQVLTSTVGNETVPVPANQSVTTDNSMGFSEGGPPGPAADMIGSARHGSVLFSNDCSSCHGPQGTGGVSNPGSDDGNIPSLNPIDEEFIDQNPQTFAENIDRVIQHGSTPPGSNPEEVMPAFGDTNTLTQQELSDIEAYVMQLNQVDRGQLVHPGMLPNRFLFVTLTVFTLAGVVLLSTWRIRR
jgi:sulfur oxidation c-type cytochrome SoxX